MSRQKTQRQTGKRFLAVILLMAMTIGMLGTVASANENSDKKVPDYLDWVTFDQVQIQSTERVKYGIYDYQEQGDEIYIYVHGASHTASLDYSLYIVGVDMDALAASDKRSFIDVSDSDYFSAPVAWAVERGITTGTSTYMFSPDDECTMEQILTFMWRANGSPEPTISNPFCNLSESDYAYKAALWAYETGIETGYPTWQGPRFPGRDTCRRFEAAEYLWNAAGKPTPVNVAYFTDVPATESFAQAVAWAFEQKIATGVTEEKFDPYAPCTRGTIMTFLYRAMANQ